MTGEGRTLPSELGAIRIADEVVSIIAGLAATEVEGVAYMSGGIVGGIAEALGRKNLSKGVKVDVGHIVNKDDRPFGVQFNQNLDNTVPFLTRECITCRVLTRVV